MNQQSLLVGSRRRQGIAAILAAAIAFIAAGYWYYKEESNKIHNEKYQELQAIGELKAGQIQQWRKERLADAVRLANSPLIWKAAEELLRNPGNETVKGDLCKSLASEEEMYSEAMVCAPDGTIIATSGKAAVFLEPALRETMAKAIASKEVVFSPFYRRADGMIRIDVAAAIRNAAGETFAVGVLSTNPETYLYPLLQSWPTPSQSAETLLVKRDGDGLIFLNELRHRSHTALILREPLSLSSLPAVQAALGHEGKFFGKDYRGVEVMADLRKIPELPWCLVTKMDAEEILTEARYRAMATSLIVGICILLVASIISGAYRRKQAGLYRNLLDAERQQRESEEQYRTTLYSIGDGVITTDTAGLVRTMNAVAEKLTGWRESEVVGKPLVEIFQIVNRQTRATVTNPIEKVLRDGAVVGLANHTVLIARDGREYQIADSAAPIRGSDGHIMGVVFVFSDVTEQYEAQEALQRREEDYKMLFEGMLEGFAVHQILCDDNGDPADYLFLSVNPAFEELTGLRAADVVGKTVREVMPDIESVWIERYGKVALTGESAEFEQFSATLNRYFEVQAFCPQPGQFAVIFEDITKRKVAEARIARLTQLYMALSQCNQDIVHSSTEKELFQKICKDMVEFGGMKMAWIGLVDEKTQLICPETVYGSGKDYLDGVVVSTCADDPFGRGMTGTAIRENKIIWCEDFLSDPRTAAFHERAEHYNWRSSAGLPLRRNGQPIGALTIYSDKIQAFDEEMRNLLTEMSDDISFALDNFALEEERKQTETALRESEMLLKEAQFISNSGSYVTDLVAGFWKSSEGLDRVFGIDNAYARSVEGWLALIHPADYAMMEDYLRTEVLGKGNNFNKEYRIIRQSDQTERWVHGVGKLEFDAKGQPIRMIGTIQDITERKQMEERLLQSQRMESIGTLASGIAHDLNNILTPILLSAELLRDEERMEKRKSLLRNIEDSARRGAGVINQVLTFARGSKGETELIQLRKIIEEVEKIARETFPKNITITNLVSQNFWPVKGNPTQIHQALLNLCINARDAMTEGGALVLSGGNQIIDEVFANKVPNTKPGKYAVLEVIDSGTGIPPETMGRIFEPFFTTKEVGKGSGLGLATLSGIVRSHNGFVTVQSKVGHGSTFKIFLPINTESEAAFAKTQPDALPQGSGETILVVDDEELIGMATASVLERNGYKTLIAHDGTSALAFFKGGSYKIDLVFTDIIMPHGDGVRLTEGIKEIDRTVKIIACTGQASESRQAELVKLGVTTILSKPFNACELLNTIHNALRRK